MMFPIQTKMFQSTYLYKVRRRLKILRPTRLSFNPRTYIRYDVLVLLIFVLVRMFQSTYLYKVRPLPVVDRVTGSGFQSTYLYKVRHNGSLRLPDNHKFQSTYLYKVRRLYGLSDRTVMGFNPRTYIRYDLVCYL